MPSEPLISPASCDLSRPYATKAAIYARLKQAGRLALLDGVAAHGADSAPSVAWKEIRADDWWAADHIPGRPLFPGVLMCESAAQLCSWDYMERTPGFAGFLGFAGMDGTRFRGAVEPAGTMLFACKPLKVRSRMFVYAAQGFYGGELVFETEIIGTAL
ncbi:MAG: 3-hydroxyacyl-ACP dehydratase FabZ family protein [Planctomycetia bacterium]|jgi:3-hydroxyacyl-[acyl-carrier-protein] dehydratase